MKNLLPAMLVATTAALPAFANEYEAKMQNYLTSTIADWAKDPVLVEAIRAQNATSAAYSQADIDSLDQAWRAEVGQAATPTISPVMENAAAEFLRSVVAQAGGTVTEVFIMDARGLNVAASDVTSDYWQGDETKFSETYPNGADAVHFGEVEFDESSQTYQGQISLTIVDPDTNEPVGAMTVGINAESLL